MHEQFFQQWPNKLLRQKKKKKLPINPFTTSSISNYNPPIVFSYLEHSLESRRKLKVDITGHYFNVIFFSSFEYLEKGI